MNQSVYIHTCLCMYIYKCMYTCTHVDVEKVNSAFMNEVRWFNNTNITEKNDVSHGSSYIFKFSFEFIMKYFSKDGSSYIFLFSVRISRSWTGSLHHPGYTYAMDKISGFHMLIL